MHCSSLTAGLLALFALSTQTLGKSTRIPRHNNIEQIPMGNHAPLHEPETAKRPTEETVIHHTVTKTRYEFEFVTATTTSTTTKTATLGPYYTALPEFGVVMKGPPLEIPRRKSRTCNATACAVCRLQYGCQDEREMWCVLISKNSMLLCLMLINESVYSAMRSHIALVRNIPYMQCSGQRYGLRGELAPASPRSAIVCAALSKLHLISVRS